MHWRQPRASNGRPRLAVTENVRSQFATSQLKKGGRMLDIVFTIFVALLWQIVQKSVRAGIRKLRAPKPQPLCAECLHAHVQYTANARRSISCTYSGAVRPESYLRRNLQRNQARERACPSSGGPRGVPGEGAPRAGGFCTLRSCRSFRRVTAMPDVNWSIGATVGMRVFRREQGRPS
jgi:hypothetical protein